MSNSLPALCFQPTGAHFLDLVNITQQPDERPEDLYQHLTAFFDDNLLTVIGGITHHGEPADEDLTPSPENTIVVLWLQLIHPGLPLLVKQKYRSELRNKSLASLKPEISQALSSLLDELRSIEDTKTMCKVTEDRRQKWINWQGTLALISVFTVTSTGCTSQKSKSLK